MAGYCVFSSVCNFDFFSIRLLAAGGRLPVDARLRTRSADCGRPPAAPSSSTEYVYDLNIRS